MDAPPPRVDGIGGSGATKRDVLLELIKVVGLHLDSDDENSHGVIVQLFGTYKQENRMAGDDYNFNQAAAVGPAAHAHDNNFVSNQLTLPANIDLPTLAAELQRVRRAMHEQADTPEQYLEIAEIGLAEKAAEIEDGSKVMAHLSKAGKWALEVATEIGTKVAAAALTQAGGFG